MMRHALRLSLLLALSFVSLPALADDLAGILPVVGSTPGAQGAQFKTGLQMTNPGGSTTRGELVYRPQGGGAEARLAFEILPHATVAWDDVVADMGATGLGSLEIVVSEGTRPVVVARAFADGAGTRGVTVPFIRPEDALEPEESATLLVPGNLVRFRFNIGVRALGAGATLNVQVFDADGTLAATRSGLTYGADWFEQKPGSEVAGVELEPNQSVRLEVVAGSAIVYGTTTDNLTNDPSFQLDELLNAPPVLLEQKLLEQADGSIRIELRIEDPDGDPVAIEIREHPAHGTVGAFEALGEGWYRAAYVSGAGGAQPDRIVIVVTDGQGNVRVIIINIPGGRNRPPAADDQAVTTDEDVAVTITLSGSDPDGDALSFSIVSGPLNGALGAVSSATDTTATVTYTPEADFNGGDSFTFQVDDGRGGTDQATVTITVAAVNDDPFASADSYTVLEDQALPVAAPGVLANDFDSEGTGLSAQLVSGPSNGVLTLSANGSFTYTPNANFFGSDSFSYRASDGVAVSAPATVTIAVTAVNDAPGFTAGANQTVPEDAGAQSLAGWATAISTGPGETQGLAFVLTSDNDALFSAAPAVAADGTLTFTGASDANGVANVTITLRDDGGVANGGIDTSAPQVFVITVSAVNDAPSFTKGVDDTVLEDSGVRTVLGWASAISAGPADESAQTLSFNVTNDNNALFSAQPALAADGTLSYTPAADANGVATVSVTLQDSGSGVAPNVNVSAAQTLVITVTAVNDAPSFTAGGNQTVDEDAGPQNVAWASALSAGPADEAGQALSFNATNDNNGLFSTQPSIAADGTLSYTPAADANGTATVTVALQDDGGTTNGGADTSAPAASFTIVVNAVNDAPVFESGGNRNVPEDSGPQTFGGWASGVSAGPADESGQTVSFLVTNDNNALFSVQPTVSAAGELTFTSAADAFGSAVVTVTAQDSGSGVAPNVNTSAPQTFTITIDPVNDAPSFTAGGDVATDEDTAYSAGWASAMNAGPNETQALTFLVTNTNAALFAVGGEPAIDGTTGVLSFTPAADANGTATVTVVLQDDGGTASGGANTSAPAAFMITVNAVNDAPSFAVGGDVAVDEDTGAYGPAAQAGSISPGPADESGQTVSFLVSNDNNLLFSAQPALDASGNLTFTPAADAFGSAVVTVTAQDSGSGVAPNVNTSASQTFTITVNAINDAPSFTGGGNVATSEDTAYSAAWASAISAGPANESGQVLTFFVTDNANAALFAVGGGPSVDPVTGVLSFTPAADVSGTADITIELRDDGSNVAPNVNTSAAVVFTITVNAVNDAPVADSQSAATDEDTPLVITLSASDVEGDALTFNAPSATSIGTLGAVSAPGCTVTGGVSTCTATVTYTPNANANGADSFTFTAADATATSNVATVSITVNAVNDAPVNTVPAGTLVAEEGTPLVFSTANGNAISVFDLDAGATPIQVTLSATNGTLTLSGTGGLVFSTGDGTDDATMTFVATITDINPALEAMSYSSTLGYEGAASITITTNDQGATGAGGAQIDTDSITLDVQRPNDPPVNAVPGAQTMFEDATLTFSSANAIPNGISVSDPDAGTANVEVTLSVLNGTLTLGSIPVTLGFTAGDGTADATMTFQAPIADINTALEGLLYAPNADHFGSDTLTLVTDDLGNTGTGGAQTDTDTVAITITGINDAPTFTGSGNVTVDEDSGAYSATWATGVSAGPANESTQTLIWTAGNDNNALFSSQPALALDGTLTFTPALNAFGSALVTVSLQDNGGTANGGVDTAGPVSFTITVTAVNDPPVGGADSWETFGNTTLVVDQAALASPHVLDTTTSTNGTLDNDSDPVEGDAVVVTGIVGCADASAPFGDSPLCSTAAGGTVVMQSNGRFTYTPQAGDTGADSFQYVLADIPASGTAASVNVTVSLTLHEVIWYVNGSVGGPGTGVSTDPFNNFASLNGAGGAGDADAANAIVFVHDSTVSGSIELENGQKLWGEGFGLSINRNLNANGAPTTLVPAGTKPVVGSTTGNTVTVTANTANGDRSGIEILGLTLATTAALSNAIEASSANAAVLGILVNDVVISGATAEGIDIDQASTGTSSITVTNVNVTAAGFGVSIARAAGTLNLALTNITVSGASGAGISVVGPVAFSSTALGSIVVGSSLNPVTGPGVEIGPYTGLLTTSNLQVFAGGGAGFRAVGTSTALSGMTTPSTSVVSATGGPAVDLSNLTANTLFNSITSAGSASTGVSLTSVNGTFTAESGSSITNATGTDFAITGGTASVTYRGTITDDVGQLVSVSGTTGGTKSFEGAITDLDNGTGSGISLTSNTGATINFSGGLTLSTGANPAFAATGGGTVNVTGTNTAATTTATAVNVANTTIGGAHLNFRSVSSNGASSGIILNNTGSLGGLSIVGTGSAGTGGTIQGSVNDGISLMSTSHVSLARMIITNSGEDGIDGASVNNFSLADSSVVNNGNAANEEGISFSNLSGVVTLSNVTATGNGYNNLRIDNTSGTISSFTISGGSYSNNLAVVGNHGILIEPRGTSQITTATISGATISGNVVMGIQVATADSANVSSFTVSGNTIQNNELGVDFSKAQTSSMTFSILNNLGMTGQNSHGINVFSAVGAGTTGSFRGRIQGNTIGNAAVDGSGSAIGNCIRININGDSDADVLIDGNTLRECPNGRGIEVIGRNGTGGLDVTVTNNDIDHVNLTFQPGSSDFPLAAIMVQSNCATVCNSVRSDVRNNTVPGGSSFDFTTGYITLIETSTSVLELVDTAPASADCAAQLSSTNTGSVGVSGGCALIAGPINTPP